ncbi:MAG: hypothetical protein ACMG6E_09320 [Candidatus Roizmanbacteria bacterium]
MEEEESRVQSGELRDKFVQDIYEEASTEEAHIFMIEANEIVNDDGEEDEEFKRFFYVAR